MKAIFPGYYRPTEEALTELWQKATIAVDANVLLNLYRYPTSARNDLLATLRQLSDRLFVPYQAALEYQRNRLRIIVSQHKRFGEVRTILKELQQRLEGQLDKLQLKKRHALINPDKLLMDVKMLFDSFQHDLEALEQGHPDVFDEDEIRNTLDELLQGRVGPRPDQSELDAIYSQGKSRYKERIPPGYMDEAKSNDEESVYVADGLRIERQYGDLLVWRQLLENTAKRQIKQLIFVTDDEKDDWWWSIESAGRKTVGPRPELLDEMRREGGVVTFYMYNSERFVQYAKQYLGAEVKQESIDQIREARLAAESQLGDEPVSADSNLTKAFAGLQPRKVAWDEPELAKALAGVQGISAAWNESELAKAMAAIQGTKVAWNESELAKALAGIQGMRAAWNESELAKAIAAIQGTKVAGDIRDAVGKALPDVKPDDGAAED